MPRPPAPDPLPRPVVDSHCHLDIADRDLDGGEPLSSDDAMAAAARANVTRVVQVGCDVESARWSADLAARRTDVWAAVALHPNEAPRLVERGGREAFEAAFAEIAALAARPQVRAVGETGLDFFRTGPEGRAVQEESFRRHIRLAHETGRTLVIHDRDAHDDVIRVLEDEGAPDRVVFHCFSGDPAMAAYVASRGWFLSFAGVVTFKNAAVLRDALTVPPLDLVLVETDAPYLTPAPFRGRANASYLVPLTVRAIAEVRGVDVEEACDALWDNAFRAFPESP